MTTTHQGTYPITATPDTHNKVRSCNGCGILRNLHEGVQVELINITVRETVVVMCPACLQRLAVAIHPFRTGL